MRFLENSKAVKKMALTTQERDMDTPRPKRKGSVELQEWNLVHKHTSIHPRVEELDLWSRLLVFAADKAVALVDTFRRVDRENLDTNEQALNRLSTTRDLHKPN
jgi:hypothetical protein